MKVNVISRYAGVVRFLYNGVKYSCKANELASVLASLEGGAAK